MSEYQPHWAESLKKDDRVLATLRSDTEGVKNLFNVYCKVMEVYTGLKSILAYTMHGQRVINFCDLQPYTHELRSRDTQAEKYAKEYDELYRDQADEDFTAGWGACKKYLEAHFDLTAKDFHKFNLEPKNLYGLPITFNSTQCRVCNQRMDTKVTHPQCLLVEGTGSYNPCPYGLPKSKVTNA